MYNRIFLLIIYAISSVFTLKIEDIKKLNLPPRELAKIKLRSSLDEKLVEEPKKELEDLEKLSTAVGWFGEIKELKELSEETLKSIEAEKLEIKTFQKLKEEAEGKGSVEEYVKYLTDTIEGFLPKENLAAVKLDQNQVLSIKKWILACKFLKNEVCQASDVEGLKNDQRTAIKILTNPENGDLLMKLSSKAKVQVWPVNLNMSKLVGRLRTVYFVALSANKQKKLNVFKAKFHESVLIIKAGKAMKQVSDEIKQNISQDVNLKDEIDMRAKFVEDFLKPEAKTIMTFSKLSLKKDAFIKLIDTLMAKIELEKDVKESDLLIMKQWLFFNQMILADDWVTRSGKFVKPWPKGFSISGYEIPEIVDEGGYFAGLPKIEVKEDVISGEGANLFKKKSMTFKFLSMIGLGKDKKPKEDSTDNNENKGIVSKALDKVKEKASNIYQKLTNLIPRKDKETVEGAEEAKPEANNKGIMSRLFGSKKDGNPAEETDAAKPEENKSLLSRMFSSNSTETQAQAQATSTETGEEDKKGMFGWISSKIKNTARGSTSSASVDKALVDTSTNTKAEPTTASTTTDQPEKKKGLFSSMIPSFMSSSKPETTTAPEKKSMSSSFRFW